MIAIWNVTAGCWATSPDKPITQEEADRIMNYNAGHNEWLRQHGVRPDVYEIRELEDA